MDIETPHQAAGLTRKRTKRCFDEPQPPTALRATNSEESDSLPDPPAEFSGESSAYIEHLESEGEEDGLEGEDEIGARNLTGLAAQLNQALDNDNDDGTGEEELPEPSEIVANQLCVCPRRLRLYFSKAHAIPLSQVFNFLDSVWKRGLVFTGKLA